MSKMSPQTSIFNIEQGGKVLVQQIIKRIIGHLPFAHMVVLLLPSRYLSPRNQCENVL